MPDGMSVAAPAPSPAPATGAPAAVGGPSPGGASPTPSGDGREAAPATPQSPSEPAAPVEIPNLQRHLDPYLPTREAPTATKFMERGVTAESLDAYQKAQTGHQKLMEFQNGIRQVIREPLTVEGVTVQFSTEQEVHAFVDLARQVTSAPTPKQIATLFFLQKLMAMKGETATRAYERQVQQPKPTPTPGDGRPVVTPKPTEQPVSASDPFGRVPSSREMLRQSDPAFFKDVMDGKKSLFGE